MSEAENLADITFYLMGRTDFTDEERVEFLNALERKFCKHCGRKLGAFEKCNCWNDE